MADGVVIKIRGDDRKFTQTLKEAADKARKAFSGITPVAGRVFKGAFKGITAVSAAIGAAGIAAVRYSGNIEQLQTSFEVMTGSAKKAAEVVGQLKKLGAATPFETADLAGVTQLLMNYGLSADNAIEKMTMLGDISQGDADKLNRIATAYGQMSSAGKVHLEDVKQMIEAGYNPLQQISEKTGESMNSLYGRISDGSLALSEITTAMEDATSAGGKYYQSMEKQSQTLNGQLSTLKDNLSQLSGDVFAPITSALTQRVIPSINDDLEDLSAAYADGGVDGLIDAVNAKIPDLISAGGRMLQTVFTSVGKRLPNFAKSLLKPLPNLLKQGAKFVPELTGILFETVSESVQELTAQLPELVPILVDGAGDLALSVAKGIGQVTFGLIGGLSEGVQRALKHGGLVSMTPDEIIREAWADVDADKAAQIEARIEVDPEVKVLPAKVELKSIYDDVAQQLTDGEVDSEKVVEDLKKRVTEFYQSQIDKVNAWRAEALEGLDEALPQEEYSQAAAEINLQADKIIENLGNASDTANGFVIAMAGKPTKIVKKNLDELNGYLTEAEAIVDQVALMTGETGAVIAENQRTLVAAGASKDEGVQINAIASTAQEYSIAVKAAEEKKARALVDAAQKYGESTSDYATAEQAANDAYNEEMQAAQATLQQNMAQLFRGIALAIDPESYIKYDQFAGRDGLREKLSSLSGWIQGAFENPQELFTYGDTLGEGLKNGILTQLGEIGFTDADWAQLGEQLGMTPEEVQKHLQEQIYNNFVEASTSGSKTSKPYDPISLLGLDEYFGLNSDTEGALNSLTTSMAPVVKAAIDAGLLDGIEGVDLTDPAAVMGTVLQDFGSFAASTINTDAPTAAGVNVGDALATGVASTIPGASAAGKSVADSTTAGAETATSGMTTAGKNAGDGFNQGLQSKRDTIRATAVSIARDVSETINNTLDIHSPSRKLRWSGEMTGLGFELGMVDSFAHASRRIEGIVGEMNLAPHFSMPDYSGLFGGAVNAMNSASERPVVLQVNGKTLARTIIGDVQRAQNVDVRRMGMGYGK